MDPEELQGLKTAAEVLLRRLKHKDYKKWLEVIALSPDHLMGHMGNELPSFEGLGASIKQLVDKDQVRLSMGKDGVVRGKIQK